MKVLIVSWFFPPSNTIAAVRLGKLAKHLAGSGIDLRVLTGRNPPYAQTLPLEIDDGWIVRTSWWDVNAPPRLAMRMLARRRPASPATTPAAAPAPGAQKPSGLRSRLSHLYELLLNFPDRFVGWMPAARSAGVDLAGKWRPDIIFASGPPFTTLLVGYLISRASGIPLVVEFRDRWSDDPYYPPPKWRRKLEAWLETRIVRHASALTTVSEPWAATFRERFAKPVVVIANGYDEEDFKGRTGEGWPDPAVLRIVYTGGIYPGYRDPSPLFAAIARLPQPGNAVEVHFFGSDPAAVTTLARAQGVEANVKIHSQISHAEALDKQLSADVLLLMQWDDPREQGNVPGKFAEYLGARRPILVLGLANGVPATVVRERSAGAASTDPDALAEQLQSWLATKKTLGTLPPLPDSAVAGFSRASQAGKLAALFHEVLDPRPVT
ncbi:MAG: glycosyltransferase [Kiloniellaceae bacterium]